MCQNQSGRVLYILETYLKTQKRYSRSTFVSLFSLLLQFSLVLNVRSRGVSKVLSLKRTKKSTCREMVKTGKIVANTLESIRLRFEVVAFANRQSENCLKLFLHKSIFFLSRSLSLACNSFIYIFMCYVFTPRHYIEDCQETRLKTGWCHSCFMMNNSRHTHIFNTIFLSIPPS